MDDGENYGDTHGKVWDERTRRYVDDYSMNRYLAEHSLGWTDTSDGFGVWLVRVVLAVLFVVMPIATVLAVLIYQAMKAF